MLLLENKIKFNSKAFTKLLFPIYSKFKFLVAWLPLVRIKTLQIMRLIVWRTLEINDQIHHNFSFSGDLYRSALGILKLLICKSCVWNYLCLSMFFFYRGSILKNVFLPEIAILECKNVRRWLWFEKYDDEIQNLYHTWQKRSWLGYIARLINYFFVQGWLLHVKCTRVNNYKY